MNRVVFSIENEVIRNTLEYVFVGKNDFCFRLEEGIEKGLNWIDDEPSLVVCECSFTNSDELTSLILRINVLRNQLNKNIPLILFSENPEALQPAVCNSDGNIRFVTLNHFFLDNLFEVMKEELFSESLAICYSM